MTQVARTAPKLHAPARGVLTLVTVARLGRLVRHWAGRRRSRIALSNLDERLIRDIGLDRMTCDDEALRPFWR
ncbi:MAG: hypothetical protein B7Z02_14620 [Rhodobacterales bacterium 32-67-9]|nr:MAG: hypothetical protein B7Z02_14620 [Rhodobacterales bacterium 32-67-9]